MGGWVVAATHSLAVAVLSPPTFPFLSLPAAAGHFEGKVKFLEVDCVDGGKKSVAFCGKHGVRTNGLHCVCSPPQDTLEFRPLQHTRHTLVTAVGCSLT